MTYRAKPKYRAVKVYADGMKFDSKREYCRYEELKLAEQAGRISELQCQVPFTLIPKQKRSDGKTESMCKYVADFVYKKDGKQIVEDVKSPATRTPQYIIKRKLMLFIHGYEITEVE